MNEKLRKSIVFGIFIAAVIWGFFTSFGGDNKEARRSPSDRPAKSTPAVRPEIPEPAPLADSVYALYEAKPWGKDPFYHAYGVATDAGQAVPEKIRLHLLGILYREVNARALINGRVVKTGDEIAGYRVTTIARDYVALRNDRGTVTLRIKKESS